MTEKDISWELFEKTGSIEAYLKYSKDKENLESKEAFAVGVSGDGRNCN